MKSRVLLSGLLSVSLFGCSGDDAGNTGPGPSCDQEAPAEPACGRVGGVVQVYEATHPGRGSEVALRIVDRCGGTLPASYAECLDVPDGAQVAARKLDPGATMILVQLPKNEDERANLLATIDAILAARPATERIGIHAVGMDIQQVSDFTTDRDRLKFLASEALAPTEEDAMDFSAAVIESRDVVEKLGNRDELSFRGLIAIGTSEPSDEAMGNRASYAKFIKLGGSSAGEVAAVSANFDEVIAHGVAGVGICGADSMSVNGVNMELATFLPEEQNLSCDAAKVAAGERPYAKRVEFVFNAEERDTWQNIMAARTKDKWATSVKLGDAEPVPAIASLRGHGTMLCDRKSYSVNLEAPEGGKRPLVAGSRDDEFYLLSMCWDQEYVENFVYDTVMAEMGVFPYKFDYVELVVDGENKGVYLLMEKPHEAYVADHARVIGITRRNHEGENDFDEFKYYTEGAQEYMRDEYYELITTVQNNTGDTLVNELSKRLALRHYLRYIAVMTALHNSDYGDEIRFNATERFNTSPHAQWEVTAWDPEDVFRTECVWEQYAFYDENGLAWCAEGVLENNVLADPTLYAMYVDELEGVLDRMPIEMFDAAAAKAKERLMPFFQSADVRQAMIEMEPVPATADEAASQIERRLEIIRGRWVDWHQVLRQRLNAYRGN